MTFPMAVGAARRAAAGPADAGRGAGQRCSATSRRSSAACRRCTPRCWRIRAIGPKAGSDRLRRCISAGEALPEDIGQRWCDMVGVDILDGIGSTEMLHIFVTNRPDDVRYGTSGKPVPGYEAHGGGRARPPGAARRVGRTGGARAVSAADGYWNQREKTRRTFRGEWTHTGDTYTRDAEGYFRFRGRSDEMLKVSGVWVSPFEVEEALISHPAVLEAAVVGKEDRDGLTKPRAFVVLQAPACRTRPR